MSSENTLTLIRDKATNATQDRKRIWKMKVKLIGYGKWTWKENNRNNTE